MSCRRAIAWCGVAALALIAGLIFLRNPKLGDDFTYWRLAFELHDGIPSAWSVKSFHALRWPVWGVSWLLQAVVGPGLLSFYGVPLFYLTLGALLTFALARQLFADRAAHWIAVGAYLFHPLLDSVVYRPMPDLSEGVLGAALICAWLATMQTRGGATRLGFAALAGLLLALLHANRFTGLLMVPVIALLTLLFFPRRSLWLAATFGFALIFIGVECALYREITGDWLHSLHANMGARGRKGTESMEIWRLPFRFIDSLFKGNRLSASFMVLTIVGGWSAWRRLGESGRIIVAWAVLLYLGYSCAIQSLNPLRPMLRDADRFLSSLAIPFAVLIAAGLLQIWGWLQVTPWRWPKALALRAQRHPIAAATIGLLLVAVLTSREFFERGYIGGFRDYLQSRPPNTKVFTHRAMRAFAFLMDGKAARRIDWFHRANIIEREPELESAAARADEFWYIRKLVWLRQRKDMLYEDKTSPKVLGSYFDAPWEQWKLQRVLCATDNPEFVFHRKRQPSDPPAQLLRGEALPEIVPVLPAAWDGTMRKKLIVPVPPALRGAPVLLQIVSRSNVVQPVWIKADFLDHRDHRLARMEVKPHVYPTAAKDFFALEIPDGTMKCAVELIIERGVKSFDLLDFLVIDDSREKLK